MPRLISLIITFSLLSLNFQTANGYTYDVDRIVAVVNKDVILKSELNSKVKQITQRIIESGSELPPSAIIEEQVLERLILQKLQLLAAEEHGIRISEERLTKTIQGIAAQNKMSLTQFREILASEGYKFEDFREKIRQELLLKKVKAQLVESRIHISDREIDDMIATLATRGDNNDEYHLAHILISVPTAASSEEIADKRAYAKSILKRLNDGENFTNMAIKVSDSADALSGGDLGWKKIKEIPRLFSAEVATMDKGDISTLLKSSSGFHIVKVLDKKSADKQIVHQIHARHILIRTNELISDQDAKTRLLQLKQRIEGGDDFGDLARSHSDDPSSALNGGDLGWSNPGEFTPEFENVINNLQINEISEPFKSPFGWHIAQVLGKRDHDNSKVIKRNKARKLIQKQKMQEETETWLRELRDNAYIEKRLELE